MDSHKRGGIIQTLPNENTSLDSSKLVDGYGDPKI